jgi:hypothetical protein
MREKRQEKPSQRTICNEAKDAEKVSFRLKAVMPK